MCVRAPPMSKILLLLPYKRVTFEQIFTFKFSLVDPVSKLLPQAQVTVVLKYLDV
jgi:hypothetical protein